MRKSFFESREKTTRRLSKGLLFVLVIVLSGINPWQVRADLILEPENQFYQTHSDQCEYVDRQYYTQSKIDSWTAPNGRKSGSIPGNTRLQISHIYTDSQGIEWGVYLEDEKWVLMADVYLVYDSRQFIDDHMEEIFSGEEETLPAGEKAVLWSYPCSGENQGILEPEEELTFSEFYKDRQERIWGNLGYYRGIRDRWICLSDPENEEIPMEEEPPVIPGQAIQEQAGGENTENTVTEEVLQEVKEKGNHPVWFFILPAFAAVVIAGIFIWIFWIRKKTD